MAVGKPLHLRLFLEGIEVPVVAAQVASGTNGPASAAIQVVPLDEAMQIHPRTMVHLFFLDHFDPTLPAKDFLKNYKLLFSGETIGFSYVQTAVSRGLILQCLDFSSYWDAAHATAIEYGPAGNLFSNQAALYGSNSALFDDIVNQQAEKLVQWLKQRPKTPGLESISGLAGGIIHMLEAIGGVPKHAKGINDFFTIAELRCRLLQQITAEENDNTAANLLKAKVFDQWLRNGLQNMGQQVTFRDMMKMLFQYIYYESVPNPAAKYDPDVSATFVNKTVGGSLLSSHPIAIRVRNGLEKVIENLLALGNARGLGGVDAERAQRIVARQEIKVIQGYVLELKQLTKATKAISSLTKAEVSLNAFVARPPNQRQSPMTIPAVVELLRGAIEFLTDSTHLEKQRVTKKKVGGQLSRLRSQIIRPDCWFAAPPRCNVLFPEQYTQLSYDRIFIQEVTRSLVLVYNTLIGKDHLLADRILAPNIGISEEKSLTTKTNKKSYRALMKHELHTGIIPRSEWLPNTSSFGGNSPKNDTFKGERLSWGSKIALFHFFKYRFAPRQANIAGRFNPNVVCGFPALVIRQPFIVPGISQGTNALSGDVIDYIEQFSKPGSDIRPPSHLVGMIGSVTHNVDQSGGTTNISMHHVRQHLGVDDEFLQVVLNDKTRSKRRVKVVLKASEVRGNLKLENILSRVTPQDGFKKTSKVMKVRESRKSVSVSKTSVLGGKKTSQMTVRSVVEEQQGGQEQPLVQRGRIDGVDRDDVLVPSPPGKLGLNGTGVYGKIIGVEVVDPTLVTVNKAKSYSAVVLYEEIDVPFQSSVPIEEILRPNFFSPAYASANIGSKIYQPFFGCDSIVDEILVSGAGSGSQNSNSKETLEIVPTTSINDLVKELSEEEKRRGRASIEKAANFIGYVYGVVKAQGKDVDDFIRSYNHRPIATMVDILGSSDLDLSVSGTQVEITKGDFGFHSHAIHEKILNAGPLAGLVEDPNSQVSRLDGAGKPEEVLATYDIRKAKRDRVLLYRAALSTGPAFLG